MTAGLQHLPSAFGDTASALKHGLRSQNWNGRLDIHFAVFLRRGVSIEEKMFGIKTCYLRSFQFDYKQVLPRRDCRSRKMARLPLFLVVSKLVVMEKLLLHEKRTETDVYWITLLTIPDYL